MHVADNWSADGTYERALELREHGALVVTRWPEEGPAGTYDAFENMREKERIMLASGADWVLHTDVDELRESPWPGVGLRDALHHVELRGANAVDHTCVIFPPTDDAYVSGSDFGAHFRRFEFGRRHGHFRQVKAFKPLPGLELASSAATTRTSPVGRSSRSSSCCATTRSARRRTAAARCTSTACRVSAPPGVRAAGTRTTTASAQRRASCATRGSCIHSTASTRASCPSD